MKKFLAIIIALIIAFAAGFFFSSYLEKDDETPVDMEILSQEVVEISEMATYQDTYTASVPYDGGKKSFPIFDKYKIPFSQKTMVVKYSGILKIGPKMENFSEKNIQLDNESKTITVQLPHSEILSHEIIEDTWELGNQKNGLFNPLTPGDDSVLRKKAKKQAIEKLDMEKLIAKADEKAAKQIENFLKLGCPDMEIKVEFE